MRRSRSNVAVPPGLLDLALDRAPEQVEDLRHDHHRRHAVIADRLEDHARVAAADVEDVGADGERVVERGDLLEQVRQRQQRDDAVLLRRDDVVRGLDRREDVAVGEHHALGRARRARREDDLDEVVERSAAASRRPAPPSRPATTRRAAAARSSTVEVGNVLEAAPRADPARRGRSRSRGVAPRPSPRSARSRRAPSAGRAAPAIDARAHRPEVHRRQLGRRGRPRQEPVAGREPEGAEPPRDEPCCGG